MDAFAAIAQPTRRSILEMLATGGRLSATDISHRFRLTPPAISQHLKILREAKLVRMEKHAQQRIYQINPEAMQDFEEWARKMTAVWDERFDALDRVLKEQEPKTPRLRNRKDKARGKSK